MRAWHSVLVVLGVLFAYEWVTTHPRKVAGTIAKLPRLTIPRNGSVVNETNTAVGAGQSVIAGEPDLPICSPDMNPGSGTRGVY